MHIAMFALSMTNRGGQTRFVIELANEWQRSGISVTIFTASYDPIACFGEHESLPTVITLLDGNSRTPSNFRKVSSFLIGQIKDLMYLFTHQKIRFAPNFITHLLYRLAIRHSKTQQAKFDAVFAIGYAGDAWAATRFADWQNVPLIWHCLDPLEVIRNRARQSRSWIEQLADNMLSYLERIHLKRADAIVSCDLSYRTWLQKAVGKSPIAVGAPIPRHFFEEPKKQTPGITNRFEKHSLVIPKDAFKMLSVAIAFSHRRIEDLIFAFEGMKTDRPVVLYVSMPDQYGTGYTAQIQQLVKQRGLDDRILIDASFPEDDDELMSWYDEADVFIFPGYPQTWGIAPTEAMARGCCTVVSDGVGMHETIASGVSGFVFSKGDVNSLASILSIIAEHPDTAARLGQVGARSVERYRADTFSQCYREIVESAILNFVTKMDQRP